MVTLEHKIAQFVLAVCLGWCSTPHSHASNQVATALSAWAFNQSIGVNVHMAYSWTAYRDITLVERSLAYLGIVNVRDVYYPKPVAQAAFQSMANLGYKFDFIIAPAEESISTFVSLVDSFNARNPGSVLAIEGPNEPNIWHVTYNGGSGLVNAAQYQRALYAAVRANANLNEIPVYNLSLGTSDARLFQQLGDLSEAANYANGHFYLHADRAPLLTANILWSLPQVDAPGLPLVITETGYTTDSNNHYAGINEAGQAKYTLDSLLDFYKRGVSQTFLYELFDEISVGPSDIQSHYGLFNSDGTPKLVATAIHNLITILSDPDASSSFTPGSLNYTVSNLTAPYASHLLLEKSNGTFDLVLWAEPQIWNPTTQTEIAAANNRVTVHFGQVQGNVRVFDPLLGSTPIATYFNVQQVMVDITDHPVIVEVVNGRTHGHRRGQLHRHSDDKLATGTGSCHPSGSRHRCRRRGLTAMRSTGIN
jgi:hypothetical protein